MYQTTFDWKINNPASTETVQSGSLLEKICDRLEQAMNFRPARNGKRNLPPTFIEANLLDDVMGPEIKRTLRI